MLTNVKKGLADFEDLQTIFHLRRINTSMRVVFRIRQWLFVNKYHFNLKIDSYSLPSTKAACPLKVGFSNIWVFPIITIQTFVSTHPLENQQVKGFFWPLATILKAQAHCDLTGSHRKKVSTVSGRK